MCPRIVRTITRIPFFREFSRISSRKRKLSRNRFCLFIYGAQVEFFIQKGRKSRDTVPLSCDNQKYCNYTHVYALSDVYLNERMKISIRFPPIHKFSVFAHSNICIHLSKIRNYSDPHEANYKCNLCDIIKYKFIREKARDVIIF